METSDNFKLDELFLKFQYPFEGSHLLYGMRYNYSLICYKLSIDKPSQGT